MYLILNSQERIMEVCKEPRYVKRQANGVVVLCKKEAADAIYSDDTNTFYQTMPFGYLADGHTLLEVDEVPGGVVPGHYFYSGGEFYTTETELAAYAEEKARSLAGLVFVKMAEAEELDDATLIEHPEQFSKWGYPIAYAEKNICVYKEKLYRCLQAHTSQEDWPPDKTASLWKEIGDPSAEWPEWSQPIGAVDAYETGDRVSHNGKHWVSVVSANVWEPGVYGWEEVK